MDMLFAHQDMSRIAIIQQGLKFGVVGIMATLTHVAIFVALVEMTGMHPSLSNVAAFVVAFSVSFLGHFYWTFAAPHNTERRPWGRPLVKFVVVALVGFGLNALAVYVVTDVAHVPYFFAALFMLTVTPASVFALSKLWAFS